MDLLGAALQSLRQRPDKVVCRDPDHDLTSDQVLAAARSAAARLAATVAGRVGILLPNGALGPPAFLGAMWAGKIPVMLNPLLKPAELDFILKEAAVDTVVAARATEPLLAELGVTCVQAAEFLGAGPAPDPASTPAAAPGDTAVLLYTSGTTGRPKGVPLTHRNLLDTARALIARLDARPDAVFLGVLPLFHAFGLIGTVIVPWLTGAEATYCHFAPARVADLVVRRNVTALLGVPNMYRLLVRNKLARQSLQSLRRAICGGDALPSGVREASHQLVIRNCSRDTDSPRPPPW